jgi:hypothetical protein
LLLSAFCPLDFGVDSFFLQNCVSTINTFCMNLIASGTDRTCL